jgi:hypothetical protein
LNLLWKTYPSKDYNLEKTSEKNSPAFFYARTDPTTFFFDIGTKKKVWQKRNHFRAAFELKASKTPRTVTQNLLQR